MPYIHCEVCGSGCYSNVMSCPACGAPVRDRSHSLIPHRRSRPSQVPDDLEDEVRATLYGQRSGCVLLRGAGVPPPRLA